jgi:phosphotransferase system enzyme I (PtsI)
MNEKIAHLYEPSHPAILRLIQMTVEAAHRKGLWVGVCGEMAGDPELVPLLLGLGVDELSASPPLVPQIKKLIRQIKQSEAACIVHRGDRPLDRPRAPGIWMALFSYLQGRSHG